MNYGLACITNVDNFELDANAVICGGVIKDSLSKSIDRIERINSSNSKIITLLDKNEMMIFLILRNVMEYKKQENLIQEYDSINEFLNYSAGFISINSKIDNHNNLNFNKYLIECCINSNYDEILSNNIEDITYAITFLQNRMINLSLIFDHFLDSLELLTNVRYDSVNIELYSLFCPLLDVLSACDETNVNFEFFTDVEKFPHDDYIKFLMGKNLKIKSYIKTAFYFNKTIEKYSKLLIDYFELSHSKYEEDGVLYFTDKMTCFKTVFCEEDCNVKDEKLMCLYESISCRESFPKFTGYIVTYKRTEICNDEKIIYLEENEVLYSNNGKIEFL